MYCIVQTVRIISHNWNKKKPKSRWHLADDISSKIKFDENIAIASVWGLGYPHHRSFVVNSKDQLIAGSPLVLEKSLNFSRHGICWNFMYCLLYIAAVPDWTYLDLGLCNKEHDGRDASRLSGFHCGWSHGEQGYKTFQYETCLKYSEMQSRDLKN